MAEDLIESIYKYKNNSHDKNISIKGGYLYYDEDTGRLKVIKENQQERAKLENINL